MQEVTKIELHQCVVEDFAVLDFLPNVSSSHGIGYTFAESCG